MTIQLEQLGKRYRYEWIFRELTYTFEQGKGYAIMGGNGSGKSTLMQVLSGYLSPSRGNLIYQDKGKKTTRDEVYQQLSFAAPYIESLEDFTLKEAVDFHWNFKPMHLPKKELLERLAYPKSAYKKAVKFFSSGMQQRLKLALAICSDTNLLLLDEPTITLDQEAIQWYLSLLQDYAYQPNRLTIIASNVEEDFIGCQHRLNLLDYKKK